jgi:iron complex outermembrane receptor protein
MVGAVYDMNDTDQLSHPTRRTLPSRAAQTTSSPLRPRIRSTDPLPAPEGEESQNYEVGVRTNRSQFYGSAALFYTTFDNRLVAGSVINPATEQPEAFYISAGETEAYGFELSGVYQPDFLGDKVYFDGNLTYNHARRR